MPYILVRHKVEDYAQWKAEFDRHAAARREHGCQGGQIFRSADDPNEVVVLLEWEIMEKGRRFTQSESLIKAMWEAGVAEEPDVYFLNEEDRPSS